MVAIPKDQSSIVGKGKKISRPNPMVDTVWIIAVLVWCRFMGPHGLKEVLGLDRRHPRRFGARWVPHRLLP